MNPPTKSKTPVPPSRSLSYAEESAQMTRQSRDEILKKASRDWREAKEAGCKAAEFEIVAINKIRDVGLSLQQASGRELITLEFFNHVSKRLPKDLNFTQAKVCISVARKLEKPVETIEECRSIKQTMFECLLELPQPKRLEEQTARESNPWSNFVASFTSIEQIFSALEYKPMSEWGKDKLLKFVSVVEPVTTKYNQAVELLEGGI